MRKFYLLIVGLFGGFPPNTEKSNDIGAASFLLVFPAANSRASLTWSSSLSALYALPSKASRSGITLLDFLGGESTVGPSFEFKSKTREFEFVGSRFEVGLGSLLGSVGSGADVKYLKRKTCKKCIQNNSRILTYIFIY